MALIETILQNLSTSVLMNPYAYFFICFIAIAIWGDASMIALSILTVNLHLSFGLMLFAAYLGVMVGDTAWFFIGTKIIDKIKKHDKTKVHYKRIAHIIEKVFKGRLFLALLIVKFLYGTRVITTIYLSDEKLTFKKFMHYNIIANIIWLMFMGGIGYLIGLGFLMLRTVKNIQIAITFLALFFVLFHIFQRKLGEKIEEKKLR